MIKFTWRAISNGEIIDDYDSGIFNKFHVGFTILEGQIKKELGEDINANFVLTVDVENGKISSELPNGKVFSIG